MLSAARTGAPQHADSATPGGRSIRRAGTRTMDDVEEAPPDGAEQPSRHDAEGDEERKARLSPMALDAKVPGALKGNYVAALAVSLVCARRVALCGTRGGKPAASQPVAPAEAVRPAFCAEALRKLGGAHYHATLQLRASGGRAPRRSRSPPPPTSGSTVRATTGCARKTIATAAARWSSRARARRCATLWEDDPPRRRGAGAEPDARGGRWAPPGRRSSSPRPACTSRRRAAELGRRGAARPAIALSLGDGAAVKPPAAGAAAGTGCGPGGGNATIEALSGRLVVDDAHRRAAGDRLDGDVPGQGRRRARAGDASRCTRR